MDWEKLGAALGRFFLAIIEYSFKGLAVLTAGIALGTPGVFSNKFSVGFSSLTTVIRDLFELPAGLIHQAFLIGEYNTNAASVALSANPNASQNVDAVFAYFGNVIDYFSRVGDNLAGNFFNTISAAILLFVIFYLLGWVLQFARQKGQGSWKVQLERKLAKKVFKMPAQSAPAPHPVPNNKSEPKPKDKVKVKETNQPAKELNSNTKKGDLKSSNPALNGQRKKKNIKSISSIENKKRRKRKKKKAPSSSPPPKRNEPDWLTNARKSTKKYKEAKAADS